jgi:hypothetical protein
MLYILQMPLKQRSMQRVLLAIVAPALAVLAVAAGCRRSEPPDAGAVKDGVYENRFFGFSLKIPEGWQVQDAESRKKFLQKGRQLSGGKETQLQEALEQAEQNTLNLLMLFRFPLGSTEAYNPGFIVVAEKLAEDAPIRSGTDYLAYAKRAMELSRLPYSFGAISAETLGGKSFGTMDVEVNVGKSPVKQSYHATVMKRHALVFILSYRDKEDFRSEKQILESVRFR